MRPTARVSTRRFLTAGVLLLTIPVMFSGCIVCIEGPFCYDRPPRMAMLHVYAVDYYTGMPIPWAEVVLYESDWWDWNYQGSWPVNSAGYAAINCGYLYYDGYGGSEEEDFRVVVYAPGYCSERYDIELSYHYPSEVLTFYLARCAAREGGDAESGSRRDAAGLEAEDSPETARPAGKVVVGSSGRTGGE